MGAAKDYSQRVDFELASYVHNGYKTNFITNWSDMAYELATNESFGVQINKNLDHTEVLNGLLASAGFKQPAPNAPPKSRKGEGRYGRMGARSAAVLRPVLPSYPYSHTPRSIPQPPKPITLP